MNAMTKPADRIERDLPMSKLPISIAVSSAPTPVDPVIQAISDISDAYPLNGCVGERLKYRQFLADVLNDAIRQRVEATT